MSEPVKPARFSNIRICSCCGEPKKKYGCVMRKNWLLVVCKNPKGGVWTADIRALTVR